jgi:competence protein ComEA
MKRYFKPVLDWLGYSRRERRASIILLVIIIITICIRYIVPERNTDIKEVMTGFEGSSEIDIKGYSNNNGEHNPIISEKDRTSYAIPDETDHDVRTGQRDIRRDSVRRLYDYRNAKRNNPIHPIDLNSGDSVLLRTLPGIGPVLSVRIVKYGNLLGGYASVEQLREVYGLPQETFDRIKGMVFADSTVVRKININTAGYSDLIRLRYLSNYEVNVILKFRKLMGRIHSITELVDNKLIPEEKAGKIRPYINFE